MDKSTTATNDHALEAILRPFYDALAGSGITPEYLVRKLKAELNAKETKTIKVKGAMEELAADSRSSLSRALWSTMCGRRPGSSIREYGLALGRGFIGTWDHYS
jgi:hypothetical protein